MARLNHTEPAIFLAMIIAIVPEISLAQSKEAVEKPSPADDQRRLLETGDFVYEGSYAMRGTDDVFGQGLTHRYVDGKLRLIYLTHAGGQPNLNMPVEIELPSQFGSPVILVNDWPHYRDFWISWSNAISHSSLWWEESEQRLWSTSGFDYPQGGIPLDATAVIYTRRLPAGGGACFDHSGWFGVEGIGQRAMWGKVQRVPEWYQKEHGVGPYISLSGGYSSLMAQGLGPSLGPFFVFLPSLHDNYKPMKSYVDRYNVPAKDVKIVADMRYGTRNADWYSVGFEKRSFDRGVRVTPVENYFDAGDKRINPSSAPTGPPEKTAGWLSPPNVVSKDPDGYGRWTWGDSYRDTGNWIDNQEGTQAKHGIVLLASLNKGRCWYQSSDLTADSSAIELHIFDPADLAAAKQGKLAPHKVRPKGVRVLVELDRFLRKNQKPPTIAATFDPLSRKLFVINYFGVGEVNHLHQYSVNSN
jgi:hypothetical protein